MVQHTLEILEFGKIRDNIAQYCMSAPGISELTLQGIEDDKLQWAEKTGAVFAIKKLFDDNVYFPDLSFPDIRLPLETVGTEGSVMETSEAAAIAVFLRSAARLKKHLYPETENTLIRENLDFSELTDLVNLISRYIRDDGSFRDENVKALSVIKSRIASVNRRIGGIVSGYCSDPVLSSCLQENASTIRDNRVVLPVRENFRGKIKGITHGSSSRGMTLFVEPVELFELNNEIMELEEKYRQEIHKILKELSEETRKNIAEILVVFRKITFLDTILARARFAYANRSILPELSEKEIILKNARHFLLGKKAVPVDIIASEGICGLLISGPNTGGKTVALKTAGLSVLMNQFCAGILADEGSVMPVFDNLLADIGDEQSISGSLSTFSAHMRNISEILELCTEKTIVLLDEPGTGTDPEEGSAITMAVFDELLARKTLFLATTHQASLKNYAAGRSDIRNASVKYDRETYRPEYTIVYGLPGESFGIDVAEKTGVDRKIILKAREYLGTEKININEMLREISLKQLELQEKESMLAAEERKNMEARREISLRELAQRQKEHELKISEKRAVNSFLRESRKKLENLIKNIIEKGADEESREQAREFIGSLEKEEEKYSERVEKSAPVYTAGSENRELEPGTEVYIGENRTRGEIIIRKKSGKYLVSAGSMKVEVAPENIYRITGADKSSRKDRKKAVILSPELTNTEKPLFELDLRGLRAEEALGLLQRQIDSAVLNRLSMFTVIHGLGEGILKKAVGDYLSASSVVTRHYYANPDSGGFGKTIVELDV